MEFSRLELVWWIPRITKFPVIGVTNRDVIDNIYYGVAEIDYHYPLDALIRAFKNKKLSVAMIIRTRKGYHIYTNYFHQNPCKVMHRVAKVRIADKGHLNLARKHRDDCKLILRVSPKYDKPDMKLVYVNEDHVTEWIEQVHDLLRVMHRW
ncbi:MAG: hypothetical protein DRJ03_16750 [Chloroflexi bacterium]|nr:MAG: hypothetical protein DRJ03_16750 [Chloroflexota bacterium]